MYQIKKSQKYHQNMMKNGQYEAKRWKPKANIEHGVNLGFEATLRHAFVICGETIVIKLK